MFTFDKVLKDERNEALRRRDITVQFINHEGHTKEVTLSFSRLEEAENIKRAFQSYLEELNFVPPPVTDIAFVPSTKEQVRQEWLKDYQTLMQVQQLVSAGVFLENAPQVVSLRNKVRATFRIEYIT